MITKEDEKEKEFLEQLAARICELKLTLPATLFLEMHRPLCGLIYNAAVFAEPIVAPLFGLDRYSNIKTVLAKSENIDKLIALLSERKSSANDAG